MSDQVFRKPGQPDVVVKQGWVSWLKDVWYSWLKALGYKATDPAFVPTFERQYYSYLPDSPPVPLAIADFATFETAATLAQRFQAVVVSVKLPYTDAPFQRWLVFSDGVALVAGRLAVLYLNSPEDVYPNVADNAAKHDIETARAAGQGLPGPIANMRP